MSRRESKAGPRPPPSPVGIRTLAIALNESQVLPFGNGGVIVLLTETFVSCASGRQMTNISPGPGPEVLGKSRNPGGMVRSGACTVRHTSAAKLRLSTLRRLALSTTAMVLASVGGAAAADLNFKAPPRSAPSAYDWTGFYAGGHLGLAWGTSDWTSPPNSGSSNPRCPRRGPDDHRRRSQSSRKRRERYAVAP